MDLMGANNRLFPEPSLLRNPPTATAGYKLALCIAYSHNPVESDQRCQLSHSPSENHSPSSNNNRSDGLLHLLSAIHTQRRTRGGTVAALWAHGWALVPHRSRPSLPSMPCVHGGVAPRGGAAICRRYGKSATALTSRAPSFLMKSRTLDR